MTSPPRPNLKEMADGLVPRMNRWAKAAHVDGDLARMLTEAIALIDSLLSERDEARNNALEAAAKVADDFGCHMRASDVTDEIAQALRAMRGNADE